MHLGYAEGVPQDYKEVQKWYRLSAEQGNADAQYILGAMYLYGELGVSQDYEEAVKWLRFSALKGNSGGQATLAAMYYHGEGVPQDFEEAFRVLSTCCTTGRC